MTFAETGPIPTTTNELRIGSDVDYEYTPSGAMEELIRTLQGQGYSQLRSQLSVREGSYLGSQEPWIEYPDPPRGTAQEVGWLKRLFRCFLRQSEDTHG